MTQRFRLALLSDVHLPLRPRVPIRGLTIKRALGALNWTLKRRRGHLFETANHVRDAIHAEKPDHIVVSGDLTNLGLAQEVERARAWLETVGPPDHVSAVPGNHDLYVPEQAPRALAVWSAFMASDDGGAGFPYVRVLAAPHSNGLRGVALIGVNSAAPRPLFNASGAVGAEQLGRLRAQLVRLAPTHVRVVVIHHPPLPGLGQKVKATDTLSMVAHPSDETRGLNDAVAFAALLSDVGAELVLHGHNHREMLNHAGGPAGPIPIVGARSASLAHPHAGEDAAGYTWIEIDRVPGGAIVITPRALD